MSRGSDPAVDSKRLGERVEATIIQRLPEFDSVADRDAHHDAITTGAVINSSEGLPLAGTLLMEPGTPVEIKSAAATITQTERRGRFYFRRTQHEALVESAATYLLAVVAPDPARETLLAMRAIPARIVDGIVGPWSEIDGRPDACQRSWANFIDPGRVPVGASRRGP